MLGFNALMDARPWKGLIVSFLFLMISFSAPITSAEEDLKSSKADVLLLSVATEGTSVSLSWTPIPGATSYILYYALPDYRGEIDINTIGSINLGSATSLSATLWSGAAFYTAILSMNGTTPGLLSNIERFMTFGGETVFPQTGNVLMEIRDSGGLGTAQFIGTETDGAPDLPLKEYQIDTGGGPLRVTVDEEGRPLTIVREPGSLSFVHHPDESFDYEYYYNGSLFASGSSQGLMSIASAPEGNSIRAKSEAIDCTKSREDYEKRLYSEEKTDEEIKKIIKNIKALWLYAEAVVFERGNLGLVPMNEIYKLDVILFQLKKHLQIKGQALNDIIAQKLAAYDRDCGSTEFSCEYFQFTETDAPDPNRVGHIYNWNFMTEIAFFISDDIAVWIKYYYDFIDFVDPNAYCSTQAWWNREGGSCQGAPDLILLSDEVVYLQSRVYPWYEDGRTYLGEKTEYRVEGNLGGHARIEVQERCVPPCEFHNIPLNEIQNAYRQARDILLNKCGQ